MSSRVVAAFLLLGFWNAGTPFEIASTPVRAAQPEENARSMRNPMASVDIAACSGSAISSKPALSACGRVPLASRKNPTAAIPRTLTMKR